MIHLAAERKEKKGWLAGPWNSSVPVPIGYASAAVDEPYYHAEMHEIYLAARGRSTAIAAGDRVELSAGEIPVVDPGETHTFVDSSRDYLHFAIHAPFVEGDKHSVETTTEVL